MCVIIDVFVCVCACVRVCVCGFGVCAHECVRVLVHVRADVFVFDGALHQQSDCR